MAITRVQFVSATASSVAITSTTSGDLILVWSYFAGTATIPTLAAGFTNIVATAGTAQAARLAYKISTGGETTSGTWTNATQVVCLVYRGTYASASAIGTTPTINAGNSTSLAYLGVTLTNTTGSSWVIAFGGASSATAGMNGSGIVLSNLTSVTKAAGLDTGARSTNFAGESITVTTTGRWQTVTVEIKAPTVFTQSLTGTLNYVAADAYRTAHALTDSKIVNLSTDDNNFDLLTEAGDNLIPEQLIPVGGWLSFVGTFTAGKKNFLSLTAPLSFVGAALRGSNKSLSATIFGGVSVGIGTQINTDSFTRANETPLSGGGNWTQGTENTAQFNLSSNAVINTNTSADISNFYAAWTSGDDQYSQAKITTNETVNGGGPGLCVRRITTAGTQTYYRLVLANTGQFELARFNAGGFTSLRTGSVTYVAGTVLGLSIQGSTLKIWYGGVQVGTNIVDGSPLTTGKPGLSHSGATAGTTNTWDDWDAGTTGVGGPSASLIKQPLKALTATFSPVAALSRRITRLATATLSFVGTFIQSHISFRTLTATLSFVGADAFRTSRQLAAILSFIGADTFRTLKQLTASISFLPDALTGRFQKITIRSFTGSLTSSGILLKRFQKVLTAVLSFIGNLATQFIAGAHAYFQTVTGTLSFIGSQAKTTTRIISGALSFIGADAFKTLRQITAVLSFIGADAFRTAKGLPASLSFVGADAFKTFRPLPGSLSFIGAQTKRTPKAFTASLSFIASLLKNIIKAFSAVLSFIGAISKQIGALRTATLSFVGILPKLIRAIRVGTLSFVGNTFKNTIKSALTAAVSFIGSFAAKQILTRLLTATLSFTGSFTKTVGKAITGVLSFTGAKVLKTFRSLAGTLSFIGTLTKGIPKSFTATLSFIGSITKRINKALTAILSFIGNLATQFIAGTHAYFQSLFGALAFIGIPFKGTSRLVPAASLSFVGTTPHMTGKGFAGSVFSSSGSGGIIDSYSETNQDSTASPLGGSGGFTTGWAQSFTGNGNTIISSQWYAKKAGAPTGNAVSKIYAMTGTFGTSGAATGSALATSDNFDVSTLTTTFALVSFTFSGANQYLTTNGTHYVVSIEFTGGDGSNNILLGYDGSSSTHLGNICYYAGVPTWTALGAGLDFCFYVNSISVGAAGLLTKRANKLLSAILSFAGTISRNIFRLLSSILSFVSNFASLLSHAGAHFLSVASNLNFIGTINKFTKRSSVSVLSFIGVAGRRMPRLFTATLSFIGRTIKQGRKALTGILPFAPGATSGATWASDGTPTSIQNLHDNFAVNGDTITIPSGTFTWTTGISFTKAITLQGAGVGNTIVKDGVQTPTQLIQWTLPASSLSRITGIEFQDGGRTSTADAPGGIIAISGSNTNGSQFRFDHNKWVDLNGFLVTHTVIGVIDHNTILVGVNVIEWIYPYDSDWNGVPYGDGSWAAPANFGSSQFVFIEDNVITNSNPTFEGQVTDAFNGGRFVIRHNTITNQAIGNHGTETPGRGRSGRAMEIYNNILDNNHVNSFVTGNRGGSQLVHDNTILNVPGGVPQCTLSSFRMLGAFSPWGGADGTNGWDQNDPGNPFYSGTVSAVGTGTVSVSGIPWTTNQWFGYTFRKNGTDFSYIDSNTSNTLTLRSDPFGGYPTYVVGDSFTINKVNQSLDQAGVGQSTLISGDPPTIPPGFTQAAEPCYIWNNTNDGNPFNTFEAETANIQLGVHYFNNTAMPGYTPYTYPHPLQAQTGVPSGVLLKKTFRLLTAVLSFIGNLATQLTHVGAFFLTVTGNLTFIGSINKSTRKALAAALSLIGSLSRTVPRALTAALSFIGSLRGRAGKALAGTISFLGTITKRTSRLLTAVLSFVGNFTSLFSHAGAHFLSIASNLAFVGQINRFTRRSLSSVLSFIGLTGKRLPKALTAAVSFIGNLTFVRAITRSLTASISFIGNLTFTRALTRAFVATLAFVGTLTKSTIRPLGSILGLLSGFTKSIRRTLTGLLSFIGTFASHAGVMFEMAFTATVSFVGSLFQRIGQVIKIAVDRIIQALKISVFKDILGLKIGTDQPIQQVKVQVQEDTEAINVSTTGNPSVVKIQVPGDIDI